MPAALRVSGYASHEKPREDQRLKVQAARSGLAPAAHAFDFPGPAVATSTCKPQRGGGHGWPPFSDRGRMPSPKIPSPPTRLERLVEEGAFFAYFLCTSKEK